MADFIVEDGLAQKWRASVDHLVLVGAQVGLESESEFGTLSADDAGMVAFGDAIQAYKRDTDQVLMQHASGPTAQPLVLLGGLDAVEALLQAAETPEFGVLSADDVHMNLAAWNARLDAYVKTLTKGPPLSETLRLSLKSHLDELQKAGAEELLALAGSEVAWSALTAMGAGILAVGGAALKSAVKAVSATLSRYRQMVLGLFQWIIERLQQLFPASFHAWFDEQWESLTKSVSSKVSSDIAATLASYGRADTETAWHRASAEGRDLTPAEGLIDETVAARLVLIGYVGHGRKKVDSVAGMLTAAVSVAAPQVGIIVGFAVVVILGFVVFQTKNGFEDVKELAENAQKP